MGLVGELFEFFRGDPVLSVLTHRCHPSPSSSHLAEGVSLVDREDVGVDHMLALQQGTDGGRCGQMDLR